MTIAPRTRPHTLRTEHLESALGIHTQAPRLSWRLPDDARLQRGYRLRADNGWDSGWVASEHSVLVTYAGPGLGSAQRVTWQVAVRTDRGESTWSEPAIFETGLLRATDWRATWIEPGQQPAGPRRESPGRPAADRIRRRPAGDRGPAVRDRARPL